GRVARGGAGDRDQSADGVALHALRARGQARRSRLEVDPLPGSPPATDRSRRESVRARARPQVRHGQGVGQGDEELGAKREEEEKRRPHMSDLETTDTPDRLRIKGFGSLRLRGKILCIHYSSNGARREESSHSDDQKKALALLKLRTQELGKGRRIDPTSEAKVKMAELFDQLVTDYQNNGRRSAATLTFRLTPLRAFFGLMKARAVNGSVVERYRKERLAQKMAHATINRELAALRRAFTIAIEQDRLSSAPKIKMLVEDNARQGFVDVGDFEVIVALLPAEVQDLARLGYITGWRSGECMTITRNKADGEFRRCRSGNEVGMARAVERVEAFSKAAPASNGGPLRREA